MALHIAIVAAYAAVAVLAAWSMPSDPLRRSPTGAVLFLAAALAHLVLLRRAGEPRPLRGRA